ncbi:Ubiquitin-like protein [Coemansia sp. BCRC 34301]|nr:Ubiquitin-like protein [Coemansia sp. BCRC 34301]
MSEVTASSAASVITADSVAAAAAITQPKKIVVKFRSIGNAPILKKSVYKISSAQRFQALIVFLRKELGYKAIEPLFVYVNSAFSPAPDETVYNLVRCFGLDNQLTINYATTPAWG